MREKSHRETECTSGRESRPFPVRTLTAAAVIAGFLGGAVVTDGVRVYVSDNVAFAKGGNGGGNGGGKGGGGNGGGKGGGGRGSGHGGGNQGAHGDVAGAGKARGHAKDHGHDHKSGLEHIDGHDHSQGHGRGHAKSHGHGHARGEEEGNGRSDPPGAPALDGSASENGISAAALGSLNAAHASPTARENASPNSMVGHIAAFTDAVNSEQIQSDEIETAAKALAAKANKSITPEVVTEVARLAEVEVSEENASAIAKAAAEIQAGQSEEPTSDSMPGGS